MQIGVCHIELGNPDAAFAAYKEAKSLRSQATARRWRRWRRRTRPRRTGPRGWSERRELAAIAEPEEKRRPRGGDRRRVRRQAVRRRSAPRPATARRWSSSPARRSTLHKLLELYTKRQALAAGDRSARTSSPKIEEDPAVRARTLYTAALILRDELNLPDEAASLLERCLDEAPDMTVAFEDLEALHKAKSDWKALAHSYRRMIKRLPESAHRAAPQPVDAAGRHRDQAAARSQAGAAGVRGGGGAGARRRAAAGDAGPPLRAVGGADTREQAIAAHQRLLARDPHRTDSYRALAKLYGDVNETRQAVVRRLGALLPEEGRPGHRRDLPPPPPAADPAAAAAVHRGDLAARRRTPTRIGCSTGCSRSSAPYLAAPIGEAARRRWGWGGGTASTCRATAARPCWRWSSSPR